MDDARSRAWQALEIGPVWRARRSPAGRPALPDTDEPAAAQERSGATGDGREEGLAGTWARVDEGPDAVAAASREAAPASGVAQDRAPEIAAMGWPELRSAVEACGACGLCRTRNRTVFGAGPQDARWLVVGEAPGADEDASGEPFVGQAGRLLDAMLASIDLDRARNVFIANVVKCRPPGNRNPQPDEAASCLPYLRRQIELLSPDLVLLLGRVAAHALLETDAAVGSLRGRVHRLRVGAREIPAVVTWHPSYLLRRPEDKALAWTDLCLARESFEAGAAAEAGA